MFWYKLKFLFPKKKKQVLPKQKFNQNYKRERERERRLCHGKLKKHNTKTHIKKKKIHDRRFGHIRINCPNYNNSNKNNESSKL